MDEVTVTRQPMFTPEEYLRVRQAISDPHNLHADYAAFVAFMLQREQTIHLAGAISRRVNVDLDRLREFCTEVGLELCANACFAFAHADGKSGRR